MPTDQADSRKWCIKCQQPLLDSFIACPACRHPFDANDPSTYRTAPTFLRWTFWFPGFFLSTVVGVVSYVLLRLLPGTEMGAPLFFAVPLSFGTILGYATHTRIWWALALGLTATAAVVLTIVSLHFAGLFCGAMLGVIFFGPVMLGVVIGWLLRVSLKVSNWHQRMYLPVLLFCIALPWAAQLVDFWIGHEHAVVTVVTEREFDVDAAHAWEAILFYEEVEHESPALLRWVLPKPIRSEGSKAKVGNIVRCIYTSGHLSKRVTEIELGRKLAFDVVEQNVHFEHDVRLLDGSFEVIPLGGGRCRVVLMTRYERLIFPRWLWEASEHHVIHTLHRHVLEGMRRKAEADAEEKPPSYQPGEPPANPNLNKQAGLP